MTGILVAMAFLTRVPVPWVVTAEDVGRAARWFPLVGAALGGSVGLVGWALHDLMSVPSMLSATLLVGFGAWMTGALHFDGLADMADGFGGGRNPHDVLRIMRDPSIGSYGAVTLVAVMTTKVAAIATLLERDAAFQFLVAAPAVSRWTIVALATWLPYARPGEGLGEAVTRASDRPGLLVATTITATISWGVLHESAVLACGVAILLAVMLGRMARRRIAGVTGDVFGASVELTETTVLVCGVLLTGQV